MKSKAPLLLMEQMVMLVVFALAAALCVQAFVRSNGVSTRGEARDQAMVLCQNAAEAIRSSEGDFEQAAALLGAQVYSGDALSINYGLDFEPSVPVSPNVYELGYTLGVYRIESGIPGLGKAGVWFQDDSSGEELVRFEVAWQEVSGRG